MIINNKDNTERIDDNIKPKFITKGYKKLMRYEDVFDEEGKYYIDENNIQLFKNLAEIVVYRHFRNYINDKLDKEELEQVALTSMLDRLHEGRFDPTKGIIKNYLYTAARNGVTNYVYHFKNNNKEVISDTLPEAIHIDNSITTITKTTIDDFYKSINPIYHISVNDLACKLYLEGFPINKSLFTGEPVRTRSYKLQKVYIKFLNFYKNTL